MYLVKSLNLNSAFGSLIYLYLLLFLLNGSLCEAIIFPKLYSIFADLAFVFYSEMLLKVFFNKKNIPKIENRILVNFFISCRYGCL